MPARLTYFPREAVGDVATAGRPWWLEPDGEALATALRTAAPKKCPRPFHPSAGSLPTSRTYASWTKAVA